MEAEEREAQSAKLQELIRRGGPQDLQEANKLMKVMAGYDTRNKTNWRAKAAEEVGRIQQKAKILEEMLQGYKPGDEIKEGDVFEVNLLKIIADGWLTYFRNLPTHCRARNRKSKRCVKRIPKTMKPWRSSLRSTTAYTVRSNDTSSSRKEISMARTRFLKARSDARVLEYHLSLIHI